MSKNFVRQLRAEVMIGGVSVPINSIKLTHSINQLPFAEVQLQLINQGSDRENRLESVKIDTDRINKLNRKLQEKIHNDFGLAPDVAIRMQDGEKNEIVFNGFLGQPGTTLYASQFGSRISVVHAKAVLQAYQGCIYSAQEFTNVGGFGSNLQASQIEAARDISGDLKKTESIAERTRIILEALRTNYLDYTDDSSAVFRARPVHQLNELVYKDVLKVLETSKPLTIVKGISDEHFLPHALHSNLLTTLIGTVDFLQALQALCQQFYFQMNASWSGDLWLERIRTLDAPGDRQITTAIASYNFSLAHLFELPVVQVLVQALPLPYYTLPDTLGPAAEPVQTEIDFRQAVTNATAVTPADGQKSLKALRAFPPTIPENKAGIYRTIMAPNWVGPCGFTAVDAQKDLIARKGANRFTNGVANLREVKVKQANQKEARDNILDYIAESAFKDTLLRKAQATITIPLNVKVAVGRTYTVASVGGGILFVGFLHTVTHSLQISEQESAGFSVLDFSHCLAPGVEIDCLKDLESSK